MFRPKNSLWITFAFCVTTGSCADFLKKDGDEVKMDCVNPYPKTDSEWKLNNKMLITKTRQGSLRKGTLPTIGRAQMEGTSLKIKVTSEDAGVYTCGTSTHTVYVASAHASPSSVLYDSETNLSCNVPGGFKGTFHWYTPFSKEHSQSKNVTVKAVTHDNAGNWSCRIKNEKGEEMKLDVSVTVVGPLKTIDEVKVYEGGTAELPCFLPPAPSNPPITGGSWKREPPSHVLFPALIKTQGGVQWNSTNLNTDKVTFSDKILTTSFNVTLRQMMVADAGVYVCSLEFEGGKFLSAKLGLQVLKRDGNAPDIPSEGSKVKKNPFWYKRVWGMQVWIWITLAVSFLVVIFLVIIIVPIYCRNKRMKRKINRLRSMQQSLTSRNYCKCDRTVRQPGTGKRARPPPLPRHQYSSLNQ